VRIVSLATVSTLVWSDVEMGICKFGCQSVNNCDAIYWLEYYWGYFWLHPNIWSVLCPNRRNVNIIAPFLMTSLMPVIVQSSGPRQSDYRSAALIFILDTRWGWVVSATPRPLYPRKRDPGPVYSTCRTAASHTLAIRDLVTLGLYSDTFSSSYCGASNGSMISEQYIGEEAVVA
jgi:hypothetical protein